MWLNLIRGPALPVQLWIAELTFAVRRNSCFVKFKTLSQQAFSRVRRKHHVALVCLVRH